MAIIFETAEHHFSLDIGTSYFLQWPRNLVFGWLAFKQVLFFVGHVLGTSRIKIPLIFFGRCDFIDYHFFFFFSIGSNLQSNGFGLVGFTIFLGVSSWLGLTGLIFIYLGLRGSAILGQMALGPTLV